VAFFYLTDRPADAGWLPPHQRLWLIEKLREEKSHVSSSGIWEALRSRVVFLLCAATFLEFFFSYTVTFWFPTILKRISGLSDAHVGWLGAVPYLFTFAAMQFNGWHSDRNGERRLHAAVPVLTAGFALIALTALPRTTPSVVALFCVVCSAQAFIPILYSIPSEILTESAAATAVGLINAVGSVAGFAGPYAFGYLNTRTGSYTAGLALMTLCAFASAVLLLRAPVTQKNVAWKEYGLSTAG